MFYSQEEFSAQIDELLAQGKSLVEASEIVEQRMNDDEQEYLEWLEDETQVAEMDDNWYDNLSDVEFEHDYI